MTYLIKHDNSWSILSGPQDFPVAEVFPTIELAADFMMTHLKIKDEAIDIAVSEMYAYNMDRSIFSDDGEFQAAIDV